MKSVEILVSSFHDDWGESTDINRFRDLPKDAAVEDVSLPTLSYSLPFFSLINCRTVDPLRDWPSIKPSLFLQQVLHLE